MFGYKKKEKRQTLTQESRLEEREQEYLEETVKQKEEGIQGTEIHSVEDTAGMTEEAAGNEDNGSRGEEDRMRYDASELDERIIHAVTDKGFVYMSPIQEAAIPVMLQGRDIIGMAQTGTGKTAAFGIPILQKVNPHNKSLQAVVLCPTRELAMQAAEDIRSFAKYIPGIKVLAVYGGQDINRQIKALSAGVQVIVGTPGRVMDHMRRHTIKPQTVRVLVLDEADEMLDMGFREDIETILSQMPEERQTALFSATMPQPILDITKQYQKDAEFIRMTPKEITVTAIEQAYYRVPREKKEEVLTRLLDYYQPKRALIFCNTKRMVGDLTERLKDRGYEADGLHGDLSQAQRDTVMKMFRTGRIDLLLATDVAARGIDVSGVDAVFNFDIPEDIEYYVHRIGRTGRAGKSGMSFTLVTGREMYKLRDIERICHTKIEERQVPAAKEITRAKAQKIFNEVTEIVDQGELDSMLSFVREKTEDGEYTAEQLAAAFLRLKMGKDLEELDLPRERYGNGRGRNGNGQRGDRNGRGSRDRKGNRGQGGRDSRSYGKSYRGERKSYNGQGKENRSDRPYRGNEKSNKNLRNSSQGNKDKKQYGTTGSGSKKDRGYRAERNTDRYYGTKSGVRVKTRGADGKFYE